ncbi:MAG: hypothetical protein KDD09_06605 [Phaeodactylibacter sp.]|nr:hypothetical protein [Phaeodactylibacter sp.]MCB0615151.1 hypothetical protein [Phaeodactylibacter sp.]
MPPKYRWWITRTIALLCLLGGAVAYRLWCYPFRAADAVPGTTAAVFNFPVYKAKDSIRDSAKTTVFFHAFPELQEDYSAFQSFFEKGGGAIPVDAEWMVQNLGSGQLALSVSIEAPSFQLEKALALYQSEATIFRGEPIWRLSSADGPTLALARYRNLLLLGRLPLQVEACITQLKEGLSEWTAPRGNGLPHLYLRVDNLASLGSGIWAPPLSDALRQFEPYCEGLGLSFENKGDTLDISGAVQCRRVSVQTRAGEAEMTDGALLNYLPDNLAWCFRRSLDSLHAPGPGQYLSSWAGEEMAFASMALPGSEADNQFLLLSVRPDTDAPSQLEGLARELGALESYDFQSFRITRLRSDSLLSGLGFEMSNPFFTILGEYVAFSTSKVVLEQLTSSLLAGKTMVQDEAFLRLWASLQPGSQTVWAFTNTTLLRLRLPAYLEQQKEPISQLLSSFEALMLVVEPDGGISGRILPAGNGKAKSASGMAWITNLDTTVASAVQYFPLNSEEQGFLIQDQAHALYLISGKGERLWKRPMEGPIIGEIAYLPTSRFGRPRMAFATQRSIHVLDEKGKPAANFPLALPSPASSPLLAVDFEGQQRYHFFIGCENGKIYGFDYRGLPLEGWSPQEKLDSLLRQPMVHFHKDNKDYLLALSEAGALYAFRRDGEYRFEPVKTGASFQSPPFFQVEDGAERIALGDERGLGHIVNFQGDYFRLKLMPELEDGTRFLFVNLAGDERKDYLAYRGREVVARYYEGLKLVTHFSETLDMPVDTAFILSLFGKVGIGLFHRQDRKVSLMDETGALWPGFPLSGDAPFALAPQPEGGQMAVIGYGASVYAYRLY